LIGFAGRVAAEKGIEYLFDCIPFLLEKGYFPKIVIAGPKEEVVGEAKYVAGIKRLSLRYKEKIVFLGNLSQSSMSAFYRQIDLLVLPSINRTESFGLVQVEAMLNGCPVVATDLPGVRVPVKLTKMGLLVSPRNTNLLAQSVIKILKNKKEFLRLPKEIKKIFSYQETINQYERLFRYSKI